MTPPNPSTIGAQPPALDATPASTVVDRDARPNYHHLRALDGLRACAVLFVLVAHYGFSTIVPGGFGVTLFFFISGFLITRLLLAEIQGAGSISIGKFYIRRVLRLYPALVVAVALSYGTYAYFQGFVIWKDVAAILLYVSNYYHGIIGFGSAYDPGFQHVIHVGVLWSLAVEEQYYLVFPVLFAFLAPRGPLFLRTLVGIAVACLVLRIVLALHGYGERNYGSTETRIDSILYGAILTTLLAGRNSRAWLEFFTRPLLVGVSLLVLLSTFAYRDTFFRDTFRFTVQGLALMPLVASALFSPSYAWLRRFLEWKPMLLLGAWSYSLYLFHQIALTYAELATGEGYMNGFRSLSAQWYLIAVGGTFALACASYYLVERPFLSLRHRFGSKTS